MKRHAIYANVLIAILFIPIAVLLIAGAAPPVGQKPATEFPSFAKFWKSERARLQLADAVVEKFWPRVWAISGRNRLLYRIGLVDDDRIVSGDEGWLYYKPQFALYDCGRDALFEDKIDRFLFAAAVARLSGFDYTFTIAPNKATVVPQRLGSRARLYASCYADRRRRFVERLKLAGEPTIIDHGASLLAYGGKHEDLFFAADTHWTELGGALALQDLLVRARGSVPGDAVADYRPRPAPGRMVDPDLRHGMLLVPGKEQDVTAEGFGEHLARFGRIAGKTVVVHDSFYARMGPQFPKVYRDVRLLHVTRDAAKVTDAVRDAERIVVSGVERSMLNRFYDGPHDWKSPLGQDVVRRNALAADACHYDRLLTSAPDAAAASTTLRNVGFTSRDGYVPKTSDPMLIVNLDEALRQRDAICVRLELEVAARDTLTVYPERQRRKQGEPVYSHGWSLQIPLQPGANSVHLVVPHVVGAKRLRFDPVSSRQGFRIRAMSLGVLRRRLAAD